MLYFSVLESDKQGAPRIAIVGPTAVGKTHFGIALAEKLGADILSADSVQVFRGMDIGTAKPTPEERSRVSFHAIDIVNPNESWTLADFQTLGEKVLDAGEAAGTPILIVGGTGLYVRALTQDLAIPSTAPDNELRERWRAVAAVQGNAAVQAALALVDPQAAARIHVNDVGRLIRALEVYAATGVTLTTWHERNRAEASERNVRLFGLNFRDRRQLYARIDARVDQMIASGLLDEVRGLLDANYAPDLRPMQALGYKQMACYIAGDLAWDDAIAQIKQETRHFARRQLIWFRADKRITWLEASEAMTDTLVDRVSEAIKS